jgi:2-phospho-L-lactate guanylyltransferase
VARFVALVPVKSPSLGKSRLAAADLHDRRPLALAFALDTLDAVRATPLVRTTVVVTSDADVAGLATRRGCLVLPDAGGLNASLVAAAAQLSGQVVAVCADLPALRPDDLSDALAQVREGEKAYVADHLGSGTTTYVAPAGDFVPRFGRDSARAHGGSGARSLAGDLVTLRHDVDTMAELEELAALGILGRYTAEQWAAMKESGESGDAETAGPLGDPPSR